MVDDGLYRQCGARGLRLRWVTISPSRKMKLGAEGAYVFILQLPRGSLFRYVNIGAMLIYDSLQDRS